MRPRRLQLRVPRGLARAAVTLCGACAGMPGPTADPAAVAALTRLCCDSRLGAVSVLASAPGPLPAIVYVHGTPGSATNWADYLVTPVDGHDSVALDRPGFGRTAGPCRPSLAEQAAAVTAVLPDGCEAVLVGHSLGGPIALQAALDHPDRVRGVVLVAASVDPELEELRWYNRVGQLLSGLLPRALRNANREIVALRPELVALRDRLGELRCPVAIVHGRRDPLVPYANVAFLEQRLTGVASLAITTLDDADHFLIWRPEQASVVRDAIARLVRRCSAR
ncbi:MAG: alpha/beta fold hydrolase [Planctomycetes bacterium]|nr:alpha/beta fold hydrolase [Planctomycetota bacterium]